MDKEKQIKKVGQYLTDIFNERKGKVSMRDFAEALYNSGYLNPYEWISVEDRLPEKKSWYWAVFDNDEVHPVFYSDRTGFAVLADGINWKPTTNRVVYWTPYVIPSPPTEKEK